MQRAALAVSVFAVSVLPLSAQVIPVSGGHDALWAAVPLAPDGAVLVVPPGVYDPFDAVQRHLTIVAPQRATIQYTASSGSITTSLRGLSAAQPIRLIGFDVVSGTYVGSMGPAPGQLDVRDVVIQDCTCQFIS